MSGPQELMGEPQGRIAPARDLVNAFEFEAMAKRFLSAAALAEIAGSERQAFDRILFRPRMMVNTTRLDLSSELFGQQLFAPILAGPAADQKRFHAEGELACARGAAAAKTVMVVSSRASFPVKEIGSLATSSFWYQANLEPDLDAERRRIDQAVEAGCKALCITLSGAAGWGSIDRLRQGLRIPVLLKGIMTPEEAREAVGKGISGIIVSSYTGKTATGLAAPIQVLPAVLEAVAGKAPVLIDGGFRRGTDILKALAMGARAVLLGRPVLWALAAYGSSGVETLLALLQSELARDMAMLGTPNLKLLHPKVLKMRS